MWGWRRLDIRRKMRDETREFLKILRRMGYRLRFNHKGLGRITPRWRLAILPKPTTPWRTFVVLHKLAHALLGYGGTPDGETMATDFALQTLDEVHLPLGTQSRFRVALCLLAHFSQHYRAPFNDALRRFLSEYPGLREVVARILRDAVSSAQRVPGPW